MIAMNCPACGGDVVDLTCTKCGTVFAPEPTEEEREITAIEKAEKDSKNDTQ